MNSDAEKWRAYAEYLGGGAGSASVTSTATNTQTTSTASEISPPNALATYAGNQYYYPAPPAAPFPPSFAPLGFVQPHYLQTPPPAAPLPLLPPLPPPPPPPPPPGYHPSFGAHPVSSCIKNWRQSNEIDSNTQSIAMVGSMRSSSGELVRASTREKWYEYDHRYPDLQSPIDTLTTVQTVSSEGPEAFPVLLCHVCSDCGRMRSAGFHRSHPVIPGEPVISSPCRRCRKYSGSSDEHCERQITHIRECKSDEPCDWPYMLDDVHVQVDRGRRRSRSRDRDDIYISRHRSTSRPQIIKKSESRTSLGLRALQDQIKSPRLFRRKSKVRIASMSPPREYDRVHVEVTRDRSPGFPPRKEYLQEDYHVIRRESSLPRVLPRLEMRSRSISPARYRYRDDYHEVDVERHEVSHYKASDLVDDFTPLSSPAFSDSYVVPTPRSILKSTSTDVATTHHRRMSTPNVARETRYVEVSSPRVEYIQTSKGKQHRERSESRERIKIKTTQRHSLDEPYLVREDREYLDRRGSERIRFVESEQPLVQEFEEMQIRDRVRSESPHVTTRGRSTTRYSTTRSQSPAESYERVVSYRGQSPGPHERVTAGYRTVQRPALPESESTTTIIDKQSFQDGRRRPSDPSDFVTVRKWRGLDENGKPATFVEETKRSPCPPRRDSSRFPRGYTDKVSVMATAGSIREI